MPSFSEYYWAGRRGHLIGVGGVSMSPLAEVLAEAGLVITGSDMNEGANVAHLRTLGIPVFIGHRAENIPADAEFVVRTAAVHDENPEIVEAHRRGLPVFERTQAWGAIMKDYRNSLCIAGTHGKTTTTSMCTHILMAAERDPTVMIGGTLPLLHAGHRVGAGDTIVMEACEYYNSFHAFSPTVAVILNIEADHLDFFKDLEDVKASFRKFASLVPENGYIIANAEDKNAMDALAPLGRERFTFGLNKGADVYAAKRAGLLHDIGKAVDHEMEGTHVALGVEFLRKYHEKDDIIHAVQAHHNDVEPQTIVACLVQAADAISAARPGARRENLENYIKRLEQLEEITGSYPGVDKAYAIQAGREVRVMVKPDQVSEDQMVILARELAKKIEEEMEYPGQIKVHVLRETTAIEYAK